MSRLKPIFFWTIFKMCFCFIKLYGQNNVLSLYAATIIQLLLCTRGVPRPSCYVASSAVAYARPVCRRRRRRSRRPPAPGHYTAAHAQQRQSIDPPPPPPPHPNGRKMSTPKTRASTKHSKNNHTVIAAAANGIIIVSEKLI